MFYRPEDVEDPEVASKRDLNMLYLSEETCKVDASDIQGRCHVHYRPLLTDPVAYRHRDDSFYFETGYDKHGSPFDPPDEVVSLYEQLPPPEDVSEVLPLRTLDIFSGCGGLSKGLDQSGACKIKWSVEMDPSAAAAFSGNFTDYVAFIEDCNDLLKSIMNGEELSRAGKQLPRRGDVECLVGGPPCQGFSGMNRFTSGEYSLFRNSLVATYLSYCDYFRPRFFILENVRNFLQVKGGMVLKLVLRALIEMGYQCSFSVMQAGQFGVPQSRRRAIIFAAAPNEILPLFPEPTHIFPGSKSQNVSIGDLAFKTFKRSESAPYRFVTVGDAISDLPEIAYDFQASRIAGGRPQTDYQRLMRGSAITDPGFEITDHLCRQLTISAQERIQHIPLEKGSDWRDLPNIECNLSDGTFLEKLRYDYDDPLKGRSSKGFRRGVCACVETKGRGCTQGDKQANTLIPWCLPHTANRHNNWAGLYGRLDIDGFFGTTVTTPEPMGKQGRVLHPTQNRIVSIRECARSQSFPDSFQFSGSLDKRYMQIGNAVPPLLAEALGKQIKKSLH